MDVPITASGYTASGNTVSFTLNYAPARGTSLTVVDNTALGFISGTFDNLSQGQAVALSYNGLNYNFVANYCGGSGNDLVLLWQGTYAMAWGYNGWGQVGNATTAQQANVATPVYASGILAGKTISAAVAGESHSLAVCTDGTLVAWGRNLYGQLGNGTAGGNAYSSPISVAIAGTLVGKTVIAVAAGDEHSLALCTDGTLAGWGLNNSGQLGNNSNSQSNVPVAVSTAGILAGKTLVRIAAGNSHSLALCSDATLASWGYNNSGQLGNNSTTNSLVPVAVNRAGVLADKTIIDVTAGANHSMTICSDGTVAAWGLNGSEQLGNNSTTNSPVPILTSTSPLGSGNKFLAVHSGADAIHSIALVARSQAPDVLTIDPATGPRHGGTLVTIKGVNFTGSTGVTIGGFPAADVVVVDSITITATTPAGVAGPAAVQVTSPTGTGPTNSLFSYVLPHIDVTANSTSITSGDSTPSSADHTDFGNQLLLSDAARHGFTISNYGATALNLNGSPRVAITGAHATDFTVSRQPSAVVNVGETSGFEIAFKPTAPGLRIATVTIANDDPSANPFSFAISGYASLAVLKSQVITFTPPSIAYLGQGR